MRVPTWAPFRLQFYFNGHNYLASLLRKNRIKFTLIDNVFTYISDFDKAQKISKNLSVKDIHDKLDKYSKKLCPVIKHFEVSYQWNIMQAEPKVGEAHMQRILFLNVNRIGLRLKPTPFSQLF